MKTRIILKITAGMLIICMFLLGMMIPMSATSEAEEINSTKNAETTLIEENDGARATSSVVSLSQSSLTMVEGNTATLSATTQPSGLSVTWSTSNTSVATVNSSGRVTAIKAGQTSVIATVTSNGTTYRAYCTVYVCVPNGVYYIKNYNSNYYLNVLNGKALNSTNVQQYSKYASTAGDTYLTRQMWKISYLGYGAYSVRPLHKLDMGLEVNGSNVDIYKIGTIDTIYDIPSEAQWTIEWDSNGYVFKYDGHDSFTMQVENASTSVGANVIASDYSSSRTCAKWTFEAVSSAPIGTFLYNTATGSPVSTSTEYVAPEETRTLSTFKLEPAFYSGETIDQSFIWYSSNSNVAIVDEATGAVTGVAPGTVTITGRKDLNGYFYYVRYTVVVTEVANGTYFVKNRYLETCVDIQNHVMASGTTVQQSEFSGDDAQRWIVTHIGEGYYSIQSKNSSASYYLGVKNNSSDNNAEIVLCTGNLLPGMRWRFEKNNNGSYRIISMIGESNGYALCTYLAVSPNPTDKDKLVQSSYNDGDYRAEWNIYRQDDYTLMYIGNEVGDPLMPPIVHSVSNAFETNASMKGTGYTSLTKKNALIRLSSSSIFSCITHGFSDSFLASDGYITVSNINSLSDDAFDELIFVYLGACETGKGEVGADNLVNAFYNKGADAVLAFTTGIDMTEANFWTEEFMRTLSLGATVSQSMYAADEAIINHYGVDEEYDFSINNRYYVGQRQLRPCQ